MGSSGVGLVVECGSPTGTLIQNTNLEHTSEGWSERKLQRDIFFEGVVPEIAPL